MHPAIHLALLHPRYDIDSLTILANQGKIKTLDKATMDYIHKITEYRYRHSPQSNAFTSNISKLFSTSEPFRIALEIKLQDAPQKQEYNQYNPIKRNWDLIAAKLQQTPALNLADFN